MLKTTLSLLSILIITAFNGLAIAGPLTADGYQNLKAQAEQQGEVNVIVTLGENQPISEMLAGLQSNDKAPEAQSFTTRQEAFMQKLGNQGVLASHLFDESPSIQLKLDAEALKKLLQIKDIVSIAPAFNADGL